MEPEETPAETTAPSPESAPPPETPEPAPPIDADLPTEGLRLVVVMDMKGIFHYATNSPREDTTEALFAGGLARFRMKVAAQGRQAMTMDLLKVFGAKVKPFEPAGLRR